MVIAHHQLRYGPEQPWNAVAVDDSFPRRFLYLLFLAITVGALFSPLFGPMLDHHFAERHPHHSHVYLGPDAPYHVHFYEDIRGHSHGLVQGNPVPKDAVYLTPQHGVGQGFLLLTAASPGMKSIAFPEARNDSFLMVYDGPETRLQESFVAPAEKPPRG